MTRQEREQAAARLRLALDMAETAEALVRSRLRREMPGLVASEIERRIVEWYGSRPGAESGDADGRAVDWPPSR